VSQQQRLCTILPVAIAVALVVVPAARAAEPAAIGQAAVERMIDLNKKAFADIRGQRFQAAKYWLAEALVISETAGLESDEMTARTYVHLAAVSLTGLKDREEAVKQFALALKINPNIAITAGLETPALRSAYLQAREQLDLPPNPDATDTDLAPVSTPLELRPALAEATASGHPAGGGTSETASNAASALDPDLPARVPVPLHCPLSFEIPSQRDLVVRCLTQKQQRKSSATFYYRAGGTALKYTALPMSRTPKGWLLAIVPGAQIVGNSLSYYVKAQLPGSPASLFLGRPEVPNALIITPTSVDAAEGDGSAGTSQVPATPARAPHAKRRQPGAIWFALGSGTGTAYHGREPVDSNTKFGATNAPIYVQSGFSPASMFQLEPELGYQLSQRFSISAMMRYQYAPKSGNAFTPAADEHPILTSSFAGFVRALVFLGNGGSLQPYLSAGAGLGTSFLAGVDRRCAANVCNLDHSDTLHGGWFGLTAGAGLLYSLGPSLGIFLDVKEIVTLSKVMALSEFNLGFAVAYDARRPATPKLADSTTGDSLQ